MTSSKPFSFACHQFTTAAIVFALICSVSALFFVSSSTAALDPPSVEWSKTYDYMQVTSAIQTSDQGYAIAGLARSSGTTLFKTDLSGNVQWQKALGGVVSLAQTSDSGYVLFCEDGAVVKTDSEGNILSSISAGLTGVVEGIATSDGGYILVGNAYGNGETYAWLRKVDVQGNILWDKGFTGGYHVSTVVETSDRGCVLAGNWKTDFWLARLDSNGNQQWSPTFSYGGITDSHFVYSMAKTQDGGFILAGAGDWQSSGGLVPWLVKITSLGHEQWSLPYGQYSQDAFSDVVQASDEGYLVAQAGAATLIRMDSSGSELWKVALPVGSGWASNYPSSGLIRTRDNGYVIAGTSWANTFFIKLSPEADLQAPLVTISSPKSKTYETNEVSLTFSVNERTSWLSYSLDGAQAVEIDGNITLTELTVGAHNVTVCVRDLAGLVGNSETVQFEIASRFPIEITLAVTTAAVAASVSFLLYVKREKLSEYRKRGLKSFLTKQSLMTIGSNRMAWTLIIISLCFTLVFAQLFFPYLYFSNSSRNRDSPFEVGVSYVYEQDSAAQIYSEVSRIKDLGFNVIRVNLVCDSVDPMDYSNIQTEVFFDAAGQLKLKVAAILNNHDGADNIDYYLDRWGQRLTYIQILNEPDVASSWEAGALFTDDEAGSRFEEIYSIVDNHQLPALLYTNFGPAFVARTNLPVKFSEKLDFVGYDVFMDSFLTLSPNLVQFLQKITNKEVIIAEFGMSTSDDQMQSDYIVKGLHLFRNMGLRGGWIVYWNSVGNNYGIRGRLAEQKVGEWIAQNA